LKQKVPHGKVQSKVNVLTLREFKNVAVSSGVRPDVLFGWLAVQHCSVEEGGKDILTQFNLLTVDKND
jgi:hypothetical protein